MMKKHAQLIALSGILLVLGAGWVLTRPESQSALRTVKIAVKGLHCQGCVEPVEKGLQQVPGVIQAKLDFKTGLATVKWDETKTPVSKLVLSIASIPHAMGEKMRYEGQLVLALKAKDNASLEKARQAVEALAGVQKAELKKSILYIRFKPKAEGLTMGQIEGTLKKEGVSLAFQQGAEPGQPVGQGGYASSRSRGCCFSH